MSYLKVVEWLRAVTVRTFRTNKLTLPQTVYRQPVEFSSMVQSE